MWISKQRPPDSDALAVMYNTMIIRLDYITLETQMNSHRYVRLTQFIYI